MMSTTAPSMLSALFRIFALCFVIAAILPSAGYAQATDNIQSAMQALKAAAAQLGPAQIRGQETIAGKSVPVLWFGTTKINNNFDVVDAVQKQKGGVQTIFVKSGDDYVRIATNVKKDDGSRAVGTVLDPNGKVMQAIKKGNSYYGDADVLGKTYAAGYEPIRDTAGQVVGIYFVGYLKGAASP